MKKTLIIALVIMLLVLGLFILTGCENEENAKKVDGVEISYTNGKGTFTLTVPKKEDGTPKYEFTEEKPEGLSRSGTFYLSTDTANFGFSTSGLVYNTSKDYKEKYGETQATFDGYLAFIDDESISSRPKLDGLDRFDLNGRKAIRYYNRAGGSGEYEYYGYFYMIAVDDIYPGSHADMTVNYKVEQRPTEVQEFDQETLDIISSLKITPSSEQ